MRHAPLQGVEDRASQPHQPQRQCRTTTPSSPEGSPYSWHLMMFHLSSRSTVRKVLRNPVYQLTLRSSKVSIDPSESFRPIASVVLLIWRPAGSTDESKVEVVVRSVATEDGTSINIPDDTGELAKPKQISQLEISLSRNIEDYAMIESFAGRLAMKVKICGQGIRTLVISIAKSQDHRRKLSEVSR
ncbi:hypothetical protein K469DRAFT_681846 [Zopfia rhizophila CBS 207.26]|uniref:Uncharacterized protein n=1 Tax=Zopfia rhizophila CBS 207.26 TaxID=1314779 RepID=A0A6A6EWZ8_9PEZI|nr:hypothetical protein K469DRAFT_681846 [Zopfia rhizophila CBS 207.26]